MKYESKRRNSVENDKKVRTKKITKEQNYVKVSKSQKQILKFSFAPGNEWEYFWISALAYNKRSNQKSTRSLLL